MLRGAPSIGRILNEHRETVLERLIDRDRIFYDYLMKAGKGVALAYDAELRRMYYEKWQGLNSEKMASAQAEEKARSWITNLVEARKQWLELPTVRTSKNRIEDLVWAVEHVGLFGLIDADAPSTYAFNLLKHMQEDRDFKTQTFARMVAWTLTSAKGKGAKGKPNGTSDISPDISDEALELERALSNRNAALRRSEAEVSEVQDGGGEFRVPGDVLAQRE